LGSILLVVIAEPVGVFEEIPIGFLRWPVRGDHIPPLVDLLDLGLCGDIEIVGCEYAVVVIIIRVVRAHRYIHHNPTKRTLPTATA
jgi:hypothetical protein